MLTCIHGVIASSGNNINTWSLEGSTLTIGSGYNDITALSATDVLIVENATTDTIRRYTWSGTAWSEVGSAYLIPDIDAIILPVITALSSTSFAYFDAVNQNLRKYSITGDPNTTISQVGNALPLVSGFTGFDAVSSSRIATMHDVANEVQAYDFDGTDWSQTGNSYAWPYSGGDIVAINSTDILIYDSTNGLLRKLTFDGTNWTQIGTGAGLPGISGVTSISDLTAFSETSIAVVNNGTEALWLYDISAGMSTPATLIGSELEILSSIPRIVSFTSSEVAHCGYLYAELATYSKPI